MDRRRQHSPGRVQGPAQRQAGVGSRGGESQTHSACGCGPGPCVAQGRIESPTGRAIRAIHQSLRTGGPVYLTPGEPVRHPSPAQRIDRPPGRTLTTDEVSALRDRAVVLTDPDGHITSLNRAAEKLLGYRSEDIVGKPTTALSHPDDVDAVRAELRLPPGVDPLLEITRSGLPNQQRWRMLTRDGDVRPVTLLITAIGDHGDPSGFVMVLSPRRSEWEPLVAPRSSSDRLLLDLDDAETRTLRWQVGGAASRRR